METESLEALEPKMVVREGRREDVVHVHRMIHELATFEGMPDGPQLSVEDLIQDGFDTQPPWFFLVVVECNGKLVGYAICNRAYSSWTRRAFYIEDLYVLPELRSRGIGLRIIHHICLRAAEEGVRRVDWHVLQSNAGALRFYQKLGAVDLRVAEGRAAMRLHHEHILRLALERH